MFRRLFRKFLVNAIIGLITAALEPVPFLGAAAQVIAFAM
jgi:hypothetical protein